MEVSFFPEGVNPIGLVILVVFVSVIVYLNNKMKTSDNENIRQLQKISDIYTKIQFGIFIVLIIFILFIFMAVGDKK